MSILTLGVNMELNSLLVAGFMLTSTFSLSAKADNEREALNKASLAFDKLS